VSRTITTAYGAVLHACGLGAGLAIAALAVLITLDVVLRNLGVTNFPWLLEVSEYVIYISTFLAAPWVLRLGSHVRVDLLITILPKPLASAVAILAEVLGLTTASLLTWYGLRVTIDTLLRGDMLYKELVIPEWPLLAVIPLSGGLLAIEFARRIWRVAQGREDAVAPPATTDGP
jgi:TRAP-type C4-dicarboxylate transport system permease small subunit